MREEVSLGILVGGWISIVRTIIGAHLWLYLLFLRCSPLSPIKKVPLGPKEKKMCAPFYYFSLGEYSKEYGMFLFWTHCDVTTGFFAGKSVCRAGALFRADFGWLLFLLGLWSPTPAHAAFCSCCETPKAQTGPPIRDLPRKAIKFLERERKRKKNFCGGKETKQKRGESGNN